MAIITGTELDDPNLTGTAADDTISGLGGRDHLYGGAGNDTLYGGAGDDAMHGDAGADIMFGGAGNDDYYVDNVNDVVSETTVPGVDDGGTNDRVYSTVSYTLSPFLERLVLLESAAAISATGNAQANSIVGNSNANIINGGGGRDTLTGGMGADTFVLGAANAANTVTITDFATEDRFGITASDYGLSQGSGLIDNGSGVLVLDPTWFATVTGSQGTVAGHGQFLYNTTTASLMWDPDGSGAATGIALARLQTGAVVTAGNFAISGATSTPVVGDISISDVTITEGNAGTSIATFTVTRTGGTAAFDVNYATADGTATAGSDYVAQPSGTVSFASGDLARTISVTINGDTTVEPDETFFVNLLGATNGGNIVRSQGVGTIANDDTTGGVVGNISINDVTITEGNAGTSIATFTVSHTGSAAFSVNYATANSTATAGTSGDYLAASGTLNFAAGVSTQTVSVTIRGDTIYEPNETFFVNLSGATNGGTITRSAGLGTIANDDTPPVGPAVVAVHDMSAIASGIGSWDPSGLAYDAANNTLYLVDSEVDEVSPRGTANMWALNLDGTLQPNGAISLYGYTTEPTGIAFDPGSGNMYITDDDIFRVNVTNVANPSVRLAQFATRPLGGDDPEDVSFNPVNGHLFIANGSDIAHPMIIELDSTGTQVIRNILLPSVIRDPEAVVYDAAHDVFFVGIENGHEIWMVDHNGNILNDINIFANYRNPVNNGSVNLKGLTLAPSSDPNDDPSVLSLYAADFGVSHVNDGRLFEISNPFYIPPAAPVISTNTPATVQNPDSPMTAFGPQVTDAPSSSQPSSLNFAKDDAVNSVVDPTGSAPHATLQGTSGKDAIFATTGQDVLAGLAARDQFVFAPTSSTPPVQHTITDFAAGVDTIDVRQFSNISASALPTETQQGSDTLITIDSNDTQLLKGIAATSLHASDFLFHA
jgi:Calx-beta domain-containing protein/hemolysin type calcium-binding protein